MTGKDAFTEQEWELVREGPAAAGVIVLMASSGGTFRETWALAKSFAEARKQHGESELLDALAAERPQLKRHHSAEEAEREGLESLSKAVALLEQKATPDEVEAYKSFSLDAAQRVAEAHKESGQAVSDDERAALDRISAALGR
jgi:hypothetical protein